MKVPPESESSFQKRVVALLKLHGFARIYHPYNSRKSVKGYPDLTAVSVRQRRVLFLELKTDKGRVSAEQTDWHDHLVEAGAEAHILRPRDWDRLVCIVEGSGGR